jgi:hypothetical protein
MDFSDAVPPPTARSRGLLMDSEVRVNLLRAGPTAVLAQRYRIDHDAYEKAFTAGKRRQTFALALSV